MNERMKSYQNMIDIINQSLFNFNNYLSKDNLIPMISKDLLHDNSYFTDLNKCSWLDLRFPSGERKGIYFIFGYNDSINKESLYIGKASFKSTIGKRMYSHLNKDKNSKFYTMHDLQGNNHNLNFVLSLDLESNGLYLFASSIEEYLITMVKDKIYLLNGTGNFN